mgnify:CR=1 FL=1
MEPFIFKKIKTYFFGADKGVMHLGTLPGHSQNNEVQNKQVCEATLKPVLARLSDLKSGFACFRTDIRCCVQPIPLKA